MPSDAFPRLDRELIPVLEAAGARRVVQRGAVLNRVGRVPREMYVVLRGTLAGYANHGEEDERLVVEIGERQFWGGTNLFSGQPAYVTTVAAEEAEVIVLSVEQVRRVVSAHQRLGDLVLSAMVARRALLVGIDAGLRLVGSGPSPDTRRVRALLARNRIPHAVLDVEQDPLAQALLRELDVSPAQTPLVLRDSSTPSRSAARRARRHGSRTTSASRPGSPARTSPSVPLCRPSASARTPRCPSRPSASPASRASTSWSSRTAGACAAEP
jgi:thioredoxin reductase (NADPH)